MKKTFIASDGVNIHYEIAGRGEPVLLVHGFVVNSESWKKSVLYHQLIRENFQVITLDLRGNGKSDKPHTPDAYENDAEANDIIALMDSLKIGQYNVVGYSRGAIISSRLLVRDKRISRAVLGGMGADFTNPEWPRRKMFYRALIGEPVPELQDFIKYIEQSGLDRLALAYMQHGQPSTTRKEFLKVTAPVLVISGNEDEENGSAKELAEMIRSSTYLRVPGDHNKTVYSAEFGKAVISFLKQN